MPSLPGADMSRDEPSVDVLVVVASVGDAEVLATLGRRQGPHAPVAALVATGPAPMLVDLALDDAGAPASRTLLVDGEAVGPVAEVALLLPRVDELLAETAPSGVVVRGGSPAALAAAQCAAWRGVPVLHLPVRGEAGTTVVSQAAVAALAVRSAPRVGEELADAVRRLAAPRSGALPDGPCTAA